jgi:hypothetical protein
VAVAWSSLRCLRAVQRHGNSRQLQRAGSGSTPHDRVTVRQICSSCSLALDQPRQSAPGFPAPAANRPTIYTTRCRLPLIRQPLRGRTTRCIGAIQIRQLARGTQIPIASAARPYVPQARFPPLEAVGRRPPNTPRRPSCGRHPKPFTLASVRPLVCYFWSAPNSRRLGGRWLLSVWATAQSRCAPARCAGARADRPVVGRGDPNRRRRAPS